MTFDVYKMLLMSILRSIKAFWSFFNSFDSDKLGSLSEVQFEKMLMSLGVQINDTRWKRLYVQYSDESEGLKFINFIKLMKSNEI